MPDPEGTASRDLAARPPCPACAAVADHEVLYELTGIPVHSCLMVADRTAAVEFPRGDLRLAACASCGFVWNAAFDPSQMRYSPDYEETQAFSPRFQQFQTELVEGLVERYGLREREILEIGCGKAEFLVELCQRGPNRGIGLDPGCRPERIPPDVAPRIRLIQELYSERHGELTGDLVCCRHTLEHIPDVADFVGIIRRSLGSERRPVLFLEVPAFERILEERAFWDLYYEHCSYFTLGSLGRLVRRSGFEILDLRTEYDEQYLVVEARPVLHPPARPHPAEEPPQELAGRLERFRGEVAAAREGWSRRLRQAREAGQRVVVWGSGSKAVAWLSTLGVHDEIEHVVDINPHKHGKFLAGTAQEIVAPSSLRQVRPDLVFVMNPIYEDEIRSELERLGLAPELVALR